jgi:hypothetical protein
MPCNGAAASANGATAFPLGCTSSFGFGVNGVPCNGATTLGVAGGVTFNLPGCSSTLGYSSVSGLPCNTVAATSTVNGYILLPGCSSTVGYSRVTGQACNSSVFIGGINDPSTPGLPSTGAGSEAPIAIALLVLSAGLVAYGVTNLVRRA